MPDSCISDDCRREIGRRCRECRQQAGWSRERLASEAGLGTVSSLQRIEAGLASQISLAVLWGYMECARRVGRSADWLLTGREPAAAASSSSLDLSTADLPAVVREYTRLSFEAMSLEQLIAAWDDPAQRSAWLATQRPAGEPVSHDQVSIAPDINELSRGAAVPRGYRTVPAEAVPGRPDWPAHYVPVIGRVAAGCDLAADTAEASATPPGWAGEFLVYDGAPAGAVAVRVEGDSMAPEYQAGDMVLVDTGRPVESGVCVVLLASDGEREAVLKRLRRVGRRWVLSSLNPDYADRPIPAADLAAAYGIIAHLPLSPRR